jgi:hypothetical protein
MNNSLLEDILDYCEEDNPKLRKDFETQIADFFDFRNRNVKVEQDEIKFIKNNFSKESQIRIFGKVVKDDCRKR